jgi:hypothetical protein
VIPVQNNIRKHVGTGKKIRLERPYPSNPRLNGYLLDVSNSLGLMHCFDDFEPDGYTVFRVDDVSDIRSDRHERHWDRMLKSEGLLGGLNLTAPIDITSIHKVIDSIARQYRRLIVECEERREDLEDFYIGQVASVDDDILRFDHFDGLGQWEKTTASIPLDEITLLQFETPYIQRFWKYLTGTAPNEVSR